MADGFGDPEVDTPRIGGPFSLTGTSKSNRYSVKNNPGQSFTVTCTATITFPNNTTAQVHEIDWNFRAAANLIGTTWTLLPVSNGVTVTKDTPTITLPNWVRVIVPVSF